MTQAESDRIDEAIFAGTARATIDGIPGLAATPITGELPGSATMAVASSGHSSGQSTFDVDAVPSNTKPGDFFKDADGGLYYIKSISGTTIDTGSPIWTQLEDADARDAAVAAVSMFVSTSWSHAARTVSAALVSAFGTPQQT